MTVNDEDIQLSNQLLADAQKNFDAGKFYNTVALCEKALRLNPNNIQCNLLMGLAHLELGTYYTEWDLNDSIMACKYFRRVIELDSKNVEAYLYCGIAIYWHGNNFKLAIEYLDKCLELDSQNATAYFYRSKIYSELGDVQQAKKDFDTATSINPKFLEG